MNTIKVEAAAENDQLVKVSVQSPGERDLSAHVDGVDLIQQVASALRLSVTVGEMTGDADNAS